MFDTVLVANRGEIALRIIRTCRELGVRTVAVYSTADQDSAPVRAADHSIHIGPPSARASYLNAAAVIQAALLTGADAIHPGYGFLSEEAEFAEACHGAGVTFVGPPPDVLERLGGKVPARSAMAAAGVPLLPGSPEPVGTDEGRRVADEIGYPVIIKASAGGGGRGMCVVDEPQAFAACFGRIQAAARNLFGDDRLYVERYLRSARHVEVQVLADGRGGALHLGTRDCSVQRRHQKLIEEAPAPALPAELTERMCQAAVRGALTAGYAGAGTFEFVVDPDGGFYFLEVNCRLQVEHPVTEVITGVDLVREQLRIAAGDGMSLTQDDVVLSGTGLECRVNAENPQRDFAPTAGVLEEFAPPAGPFVRVDTHARPGYRIPAEYDSLLAKVIVWAPTRDAAIARADRAIAEFAVSGPCVATTLPFLSTVLGTSEFRAATHDTGLVARLRGG